MKKFKQGQTVYTVRADFFTFKDKTIVEVFAYFLYSHKEPLPPEGCVIEKMPVNEMNILAKIYPQDLFTTSRRKANSRAKQLQLVIDAKAKMVSHER